MTRMIVQKSCCAPGTILESDPYFTCLDAGERVVVEVDGNGDLFIPCHQGRHYLDGQETDDAMNYIGLRLMDPKTTAVGAF